MAEIDLAMFAHDADAGTSQPALDPMFGPMPADAAVDSDAEQPSAAPEAALVDPSGAKQSTLVVTHAQCVKHSTHNSCPEQPARVRAVMTALKKRHTKMRRQLGHAPFALLEMTTSKMMLAMLEAQVPAAPLATAAVLTRHCRA